MNKRTNIVLAVIAAALFGYIVFYERHQLSTADMFGRRGRLLEAFDRELLSQIAIERPGGRVVLERVPHVEGEVEQERFRLVEPVSDDTDYDRVDSLLVALEWAEDRRKLEGVDEADLARFGLDTPALSASYTVADSVFRIHFGGDDPQGAGRYVTLDDPTVVYVVGIDLFEAFDRPASDFRSKELVSSSAVTRASALEIAQGSDSLRLEKRGGRWWLGGDSGGLADTHRVERLLAALGEARIASFPEPIEPPQALAAAGLEPPEASIAAEIPNAGGDGIETVRFDLGRACPTTGEDPSDALPSDALPSDALPADEEVEPDSAAEGTRFVRRGTGPVVCVSARDLAAFEVDAEGLRERRLVQSRNEEVRSIELAAGDQRIEIARTENGWRVGDDTADAEAVADWLDDLRAIELEDTVPLTDDSGAALGLAPPAIAVTIHRTGDDEPDELALARPAGSTVLARRGREPFAVRVPAAVFEHVTPTALPFRARAVVEAPPAAATQLEITRGPVTESMAREGDTWRITTPPGHRVDEPRVRTAIETLSRLRVERFVAAASTREHGLVPPALVARVHYEDEPEHMHGAGHDDEPLGEVPAAPVELRIGGETVGGVFASLGDDPVVFVIPAHVVEALRDPFVDRQLGVAPEEVSRVIATAGATETTVEVSDGRARSSAGPRDGAEILDLATTLRAEAVDQYGQAPGAGFETPRARLRVERTDGEPYEIVVGERAAADSYLVRRSDIDATFRVRASVLAPLLGE